MLQAYYEKRPLSGVGDAFRSKGFSTDWQSTGPAERPLNLAALPPFLRTLLVTDGTVTKALEAYYWEHVAIDGVSNTRITAQFEIDWLSVQAGEELLARNVLLRGVRSKSVYASAFSIIRLSAIPQGLRDRLLAGTLGIGELIRDCGLETYRDLLDVGATRDMAEFGGPRTDAECVYRTYRIIFNHQPAIMVSECFPISVFM